MCETSPHSNRKSRASGCGINDQDKRFTERRSKKTMSAENPTPASTKPGLWRNWLSLSGLVVIVGSVFSFLLLFMLDSLAHFANPYIGVLTYLVAPGLTGRFIRTTSGTSIGRAASAATTACTSLPMANAASGPGTATLVTSSSRRAAARNWSSSAPKDSNSRTRR
jgi:hypothetical protein